MVHRDIKPENILIHDGQALVADFGIALAASKASGARMTETGMSLGTPHYMSPEQAMGEREITAALRRLCARRGALRDADRRAALHRQYRPGGGGPRPDRESPRPLGTQRHTIPRHVEAAVLTALEKLPADRFASAAEFADALKDKSYASTVVAGGGAGAGSAQPRAPSAVEHRHNRAGRVAAVGHGRGALGLAASTAGASR